jgi:chromosome partitioning protein
MCTVQHVSPRDDAQEDMMFTVALCCSKGGAGKTTMAVHLAVEGDRRGYKTLLIDIDTQASAAKIMDRRGDAPPDVTTEAAGRLEKAIRVANAEGYELVVVDTAPQADRAAAQAARIADLVVAPVQPSIVDLDAVDATVDICKLTGVPILFVLNRVPPQGQEVAGTEEAIRKRGMPVAEVRWGERKAFKYPFMRGLTAQEVEPDSKAANEVAALFDVLNIPSPAHVRTNAGTPARLPSGVKG